MEKIDKVELNKQVSALIETDNEARIKFYEWLKNIIAIAVGFIAIIVSLKTKKSETNTEHYLYLLMLCSNVFGILSGIIVLHGEIKVLRLAVTKRKQSILDGLNEKSSSPYPKISFVARPSIYIYIEYFCYFSFIISLITLVLYSVASDKI